MGSRIVHAFKASCSLMLPIRGREKTKAWNKILSGKWACVLSVWKHPVHTCVRTTWFRMQLLFQIYMPFDPTSFVNVTELSCCVIARVYAICRIWGQYFSRSLPVGERNRYVKQHLQRHHNKIVPFNFFFFLCACMSFLDGIVRTKEKQRPREMAHWRTCSLDLTSKCACVVFPHAQTYHTDNKTILLWYIYLSLFMNRM